MKATLFRGRIAVVMLVLAVVVLVPLLVWQRTGASRQGQSAQCGNNMVAIVSAARLWSNDNGDHFPRDFLVMSNELTSPHILKCPSDKSRPRLASWAGFTASQSSYEILAPGVAESDTQAVYLRCQIHGHLGYVDGTVFDGVRRRRKL